MPWQEEWTRTQQELSAASRNEHWWKTLPQDRRSILGREEYRRQCRLARQRLKVADERCRTLMRSRRDGAPHEEPARIEAKERGGSDARG